MKTYAVLLRGINVGGKNRVPMADLKQCLESLGFSNVTTYIASGNVVLQSDSHPHQIQVQIERALPTCFALDTEVIRVQVLSKDELKRVVDRKPAGFGEQPDRFHSDVIFLIDIDAAEAMAVFDPREGVDRVWQGEGVIYSQRLSAERAKSRLGKIIGTLHYRSMTIRNWNTTVKLLELVNRIDADNEA